jgi:hypothetical protein
MNGNEDLLQFAWQYKVLKPKPLITKSGKTVEIIKQGELNRDSGADFFNARIKLDGLTLAGNIEIHVNSSDWLKHKHQEDKSYDNIILHVVYNDDKIIPQNSNNNVEVLELKELLPDHFIENYEKLIGAKTELPCKNQLNGVNELKASSWMQRMAIERLELKTEMIETVFANFNNDFTQTFYAVLLKNFGFKVNALPFELLANYLPAHLLLKHSHDQKQVEALLFGTAGLLDDLFEDKYLHGLQSEYEFLKNKYKLSSLKKEIFKYSRLRPANFPDLRLAQFAQLICRSPKLISEPQSYTNVKALKEALQFEPNGYWAHHYKADGKKSTFELKLGEDSIQNILINTFSYFFFFYGKKLNKEFYQEFALEILEDVKFESNVKTKNYMEMPCGRKTGLLSQGLINLNDNYCSKKACLNCGIGAAILQSTAS